MNTTLHGDNVADSDLDPSKVVALSVGDVNYSVYLPNLETDYIQKKIATNQVPYEIEMLDDIRSRISLGDLVLDIGANVGNHTLYMAAVTGCRVVAFEPNALLASALAHSLHLNGLTERVTVQSIGLGRESAQGGFKQQIADNLGAQSLEIGEGGITIRALDELDFAGPVKLLKIDVEGMELAVLAGGAKLIARDRPLLYVECISVEEYKAIAQWMAGQNYTYWETFNATPTHLFMPLEQVTIDQRLERLQRKDVIESYHVSQQLQPLRASLTAANQKYRDACQRIDTLKAQISQGESASKALDQKLTENQRLLADARAEVQHEQQRFAEQERDYRLKLEELAMGLKAAATDRFDRQSLEQELRAQVHEARRTLDSERARCALLEKNLNQREQMCEQQAQELLQMQERIDKLRLAYDVLSEDVESLKLQCEEHVSSRQAADQVLAATREQNQENQRQLETTQNSLDSERKAFIEQVTQLNQLLARKAEAVLDKEQRIATLEGELVRADEQFVVLTQENRSVAVQLETVTQQFEHEQAAKKALEALLQATEAQSHEQQALLTQALSAGADRNVLQIKNETLEAALIEAQRNMEDMQSQFTEQQRQHTEQHQQALDALRQQHELESRALRQQHEQELTALRGALEQQHVRVESLGSQLRAETERRQLAEQRLIKTRASLTYQLGYQIKTGTRSLNGLARLPGSLVGLYRQARKLNQATQTLRLPPATQFVAPQGPHEAPVLLDTTGQGHEPLHHLPGKSLKMACVMDEFTFGSYDPEANLLQLTPHNWQAELEAFKPQLLFIESAWRGKDELWGSKVGHNASELQNIVHWCKLHQVPTVFWNKEDPVHFETFLTTAKQFDHVFTTDMDCIHRYKAALGHNQVYFLPFACQPTIHNPIERYERKDAFCFAGAYYVRYPERTRDLGNFVEKLTRFKPVEIYDRNFGKDDPNYQFPAEYQPFIVGTLKFNEIDRAYKGYNYAINLNSIKQSQTMFARRVYELLGCNTMTLSNYSRGVRLMFGDLVITTDSGDEMVRRLERLAADPETSDKLRLAALRKVMQEHTYEQRLGYVMAKVTGTSQAHVLPSVAVVAYAKTTEQVEQLLASFQRQTLEGCTLHILLGKKAKAPSTEARVNFIASGEAKGQILSQVVGDVSWVAGFVAQDYYGPNYLLDLALATRYSQACAFGKIEHFQGDGAAIQLQNLGRAYHKSTSLAVRSALAKADGIQLEDFTTWVRELDTLSLDEGRLLAIDRYNYCRDAQYLDPQALAARVNDLTLDTGLSIEALQQRAEAIAPAARTVEAHPELSITQLSEIFGPCRSKNVTFTLQEHGWLVKSTLEDGKHEYVYAAQDIERSELTNSDEIQFFVDVTPGLNIQLVMLFLDSQKQRVSHVIKHPGKNKTVQLPPEATFIRLGWRIYQGGSAEINGLLLGHKDLQPSEILGKAEHLLVTNHYPSYDDLYRNGFVHSRVWAYREQGVGVDVFRLRKDDVASYHEFENVDVITGGQSTLRNMLDSGRYQSVLVHFLDPLMWEVLQEYIDKIKVTVWVHGAEVQPWWRREYNFTTEAQLQIGKLESDKRLAFWRGLLSPIPDNLKLVFVSRYFAEEVMEDLAIRVPESQYEIIHNPIDVGIFNYQEKPVEQRKKILSIRPYASPKYANDLSAKAIELLAGKPFFNELEFRMIGDGPLFEEILGPLRKYPNVIIERRFLSQKEIATLHKDYGVFLCPTRMDAQGVSRDEAMSSGLVPVTNGVTAIPEFVSEDCGVLAQGDDAQGMADGIASLFTDPGKFEALSSAAAARVRGQTSTELIISRELAILNECSVFDALVP
ncbi:FkbM family methyltransferase [Pseudomonas sp. Irchel 3E20]|uniref:FkbM family methyltransferase n=1 Tax=Pseudomonas sp. Irchel 3E20 TaxID=2008983 RepID=UPI000BA46DE7|nr:FkbM family methyltransferase [Pseudomonas sp. Irchel 3E20]